MCRCTPECNTCKTRTRILFFIVFVFSFAQHHPHLFSPSFSFSLLLSTVFLKPLQVENHALKPFLHLLSHCSITFSLSTCTCALRHAASGCTYSLAYSHCSLAVHHSGSRFASRRAARSETTLACRWPAAAERTKQPTDNHLCRSLWALESLPQTPREPSRPWQEVARPLLPLLHPQGSNPSAKEPDCAHEASPLQPSWRRLQPSNFLVGASTPLPWRCSGAQERGLAQG